MTTKKAIDIIKCLAWHTRPDEEDIEQAIETLEHARWISCDERLPEVDGTYLVTVRNLTGYRRTKHIVFECDYYCGNWVFHWWEDNEVVAWMPLPQPYKIESEDEE